MKRQGHKHKESFSILLLSNTGRGSRQFHISQFTFYLVVALLAAVLVVMAALSFFCAAAYREQSALRKELETQETLVQQLEAEKKTIRDENTLLKSENEALRQSEETNPEEESNTENEESEPEADPAFPGLYPSSGACVIESVYTEEQQYLSINTNVGDNIIAAGRGTVTAISSDDTYAHIIEVEHGNGYRTRYLCRQQAEPMVQEGEQVLAGSTLLAVVAENTQMDYQVIFQDVPVDPLTVIQAQG